MPRKASYTDIDFDEAHSRAYHSKPIVIRSSNGEVVKFYNLKHRKPEAWQNDMCEIEIGDKRAIVKNEDVMQVLSLM